MNKMYPFLVTFSALGPLIYTASSVVPQCITGVNISDLVGEGRFLVN